MVLPRSMRLQGHKCFDHLHRSGSRYHSQSMILKVAKAKNQLLKPSKFIHKEISCRCAVAISNKVSKKAVIRNKLRRILHQHLRSRLAEKKQLSNKWALLSLKPKSISLEHLSLLQECDKLLNEAGLLL